MSFWDTWLAPGDLRARHAALAPRPNHQHKSTQTLPPRPAQASTEIPRIGPEHRARRQNALFFGGLTLTLLSAIITRRSLARKRLPTPQYFGPSNAALPKIQGGVDAAEALGLATLTTVSVFMVGLGAASMVWDVADVEDLRERVRRGVGFDVYGGDGDAETDREMEEWAKGVMARGDGNVGVWKEEIVGKLFEIERKEMEKKAKEDKT